MKKRNIIAGFSALSCLALLPIVQAAPVPETPDPGSTCAFCTADGINALLNASAGGGTANSAFGWFALFANTDASFNTAVGTGALLSNNGSPNTAVGAAALLFNTTGTDMTAVGVAALEKNQIASDNNAVGSFALFNNDSSGSGSANFNNAFGRNALTNNVDGDENDSFGDDSMEENTTGSQNTAMGDDALDGNTTGNGNVAVGKEAGNSIVDGNDNVVLGHNAGIGIVHASRNVAIGSEETGPFADFDDTCFIGSIFGEIVSDPGSQTAVFVDQFNVVGIFNSSQKYKHDIQPMDKASEVLYQLKPVTFKFNSDWKGTTQYGLIAEDVAKVDPLLVSRKAGDIVTVHYEQINNMLLNEFLKEHKKVQDLETTVAQQQKGMEVLTAQLKEQAAQIQKVSAQLEVSKPAPQVVVSKP
jgi:endosialidase-like protein